MPALEQPLSHHFEVLSRDSLAVAGNCFDSMLKYIDHPTLHANKPLTNRVLEFQFAVLHIDKLLIETINHVLDCSHPCINA